MPSNLAQGEYLQIPPSLSETIPAQLRAGSAILDGEIVCLDHEGKTQFEDLLFRRGEPRFCAFDLLWANGNDLRYVPLVERKWRLRLLVPSDGSRLLYRDYIENDGEGLCPRGRAEVQREGDSESCRGVEGTASMELAMKTRSPHIGDVG